MENNNIEVISNLENIKNNYDFIFSEQTFEHISNPKETLFELSQILNVGGYIFLRFPSTFLFKSKLSNNYKPNNDCAHPLEHINLFKKKSFEAMIQNSNLRMINIRSQYNFSFKNVLKDIKNFFYFDSVLLKKINE